MAWYAELKRRKWHRINGVDMIQIYRKKLYDDWYNSLTDEQKQRLEEYRKAKAEKNRREAREAMQRLMMMTGLVAEKYYSVCGESSFIAVENSLGGCRAITRLLQ